MLQPNNEQPQIVSISVSAPTNTDLPTNTGEIPEFPSVALPVVAVLGLLVIFGHRKE